VGDQVCIARFGVDSKLAADMGELDSTGLLGCFDGAVEICGKIGHWGKHTFNATGRTARVGGPDADARITSPATEPGERMDMPKIESKTKLLAVDIDGCLVPVQHATYDLATLSDIAELNRQSRLDDTVPPLTIISGRPHAYVDALMQILDIAHPASFENGAGLAFRKPYHATLVPEAVERAPDLEALAHRLRERSDMIVQPGKIASLTVLWYPTNKDVRELAISTERHIRELGLDLIVEPSQDCVNVLVPGVDKTRGLLQLAETIGLDVADIAGIGDSVGDIEWLKLCGASCAPANAHPDVRSAVTYRASRADAAALLEFYRALIAENRRLAREA
jgi:HAD superfamily hydrolase (TIGR01484 family)